ncbi:NmrA family NAD(P)-binding protein [Chryseobacterium sp. YIM B08800]|uniref:NmrA family NAD(P)-binding protein n=1 Tax=Chryseobacterium sp. YIM B08800 TaxID=2984136 RepID=UPI00223FDC33|nr:NmrA family NAD(P)-binding protein [Chryseobacterium sp. YIM B08800]
MLNNDNIILVTGATGSQGGAVATALLKRGNKVRVMVRKSSIDSSIAQALNKAGAEIVIADLEDKESIELALQNVYGLFSVQAMSDGTDSERRHADILVDAALRKNVQHVIHVSVSQLGNYQKFPKWGENRWNEKYWLDKSYAEEKVKNAGFKYWTILRPTFLMDNFVQPKVNFMYPGLDSGKITVVFNAKKETTIY